MRTFRPCLLGLLVAVPLACSSPEPPESTAETEAETTTGAPADVANPESFPDVVATVNGVEIRKDELMDRAAGVEARGPDNIDTSSMDFYRRVLDEIIGSELLYRASQQEGLEADGAQVDSQMDALRGRFPEPELFEQALAAEGLTVEALRDRIERDLSIQKLVETRIGARVSVSDGEARDFYEENVDQMSQPEQLRLRHILKRVDADAGADAREAARTAIEELHARASAGNDFAALAGEHSEDPGSAANGGELVVSRGQTVPPFEQAAFALEPGELSPVVETQFGFHIIELAEKIPAETVPFDVAAPRIEEFLRQQALQQEIEREVESLKSEARLEIFL